MVAHPAPCHTENGPPYTTGLSRSLQLTLYRLSRANTRNPGKKGFRFVLLYLLRDAVYGLFSVHGVLCCLAKGGYGREPGGGSFGFPLSPMQETENEARRTHNIMKRLLALTLAVLMLAAGAVTALAEETAAERAAEVPIRVEGQAPGNPIDLYYYANLFTVFQFINF